MLAICPGTDEYMVCDIGTYHNVLKISVTHSFDREFTTGSNCHCLPSKYEGGNVLVVPAAKAQRIRPRQHGRNFADDIFKCILFNENVRISIKISPRFIPKGTVNNIHWFR